MGAWEHLNLTYAVIKEEKVDKTEKVLGRRSEKIKGESRRGTGRDVKKKER